METLGAYLKSKREALNISLQEVSQVTRIRRSILEAVENNQYDLLPPKVFAQGFIKSYASYLGLDESEVVKRYAELVERPEADLKSAELRTPASASRSSFSIVLMVLIVLMLAAAFLWRMNARDQKTAETVPPPLQTDRPTTSIVSMTTSPGGPVAAESGRETAAPAVIDAASSPATAVVVQQPPATDVQPAFAPEQPLTATVVSPAAVTFEKPPADAAAAPLVLKIVASRDTWLRIQSDKETPRAFTLNSGQTRTFNAVEKFTIRIGNAGGVALFLNEKDLGIPGKPGEVLQLTLPE